MELLLDTHVFLWWQSNTDRLGQRPRDLIADQANRIWISAASVWEIAIKRRQGRLTFEGAVAAAIIANGFLELPCDAADAEDAGALDWSHSDPFDRMILAQARRRGLRVITADPRMLGFSEVALISAI